MKNILTLIFFCVALFAKADFWTQKANFPGEGRELPIAFSVGNKGYIGTGKNFTTGYLDDFWEYDPATNVWTQKATFAGGARFAAVGFSINNKGYVGTGVGNAGVFNDFWEYDPATNVWTQKANFGGAARDAASGFSINGKGYIGSGSGNTDFWEYDPATNIWTQKANLTTSSTTAVGFSLNGKGYFCAGSSTPDVWEYDPILNTWTQKADLLPANRYDAAGFAICNMGYVGTGESPLLNDLWQYDPLTNQWTQKANVPGIPRDDFPGFSIGSKGYGGLGDASGTLLSDFWEYTPDNPCSLDDCFGDSTHFSVPDPAVLAGAQWNFGDTASGVNNVAYIFNPIHLYTAAGTFYVELIQYFLLGGSDTLIYPLTIYPNPQVNLGNDTTVCDGTAFTMNAGSGFSSYLWQDGSTDSTFTATTAGTYFVTISNGSCTATDSLVLSTIPCVVPVVAFSSDDSSFCGEHCFNFTDLSTNAPTSWAWSFPGASPDTSNLQNPQQICYHVYGTYTVTLVASNSVGSGSAVYNSFIGIYQNPPAPVITISGPGGDTLTSTPAFAYQWYYNGQALPGDTSQVLYADSVGSYWVTISDANGCTSTATAVFVTGIESIFNNGQVNIYPNPVDQTAIISWQLREDAEVNININDMLGQNVLQYKNTIHAGLSSETLDLSKLSSGVYFIDMKIKEEHVVRKFIKR